MNSLMISDNLKTDKHIKALPKYKMVNRVKCRKLGIAYYRYLGLQKTVPLKQIKRCKFVFDYYIHIIETPKTTLVAMSNTTELKKGNKDYLTKLNSVGMYNYGEYALVESIRLKDLTLLFNSVDCSIKTYKVNNLLDMALVLCCWYNRNTYNDVIYSTLSKALESHLKRLQKEGKFIPRHICGFKDTHELLVSEYLGNRGKIYGVKSKNVIYKKRGFGGIVSIANAYGISESTLRDRLNKGMLLDEAIDMSVASNRGSKEIVYKGVTYDTIDCFCSKLGLYKPSFYYYYNKYKSNGLEDVIKRYSNKIAKDIEKGKLVDGLPKF